MKEPTLKELGRMPNEQWARALRLFFRDHHHKILTLQWELIQSDFCPGDGCARMCYQEATRRVRKSGEAVHPYRPRLNEPEVEMPKKRGKDKTQGKVRKDWNGHNACGLLRWMGKEGFSLSQAMCALSSLGIHAVEATARIQMRKGKQGMDVPSLTDEQRKQLKGKQT